MTGKEKSDLVLRLQFDFINNAFCDVVTKKYYRKYKDTRPFAANPDSNKYKLVDSVQQAALGQGVLKYTDAYRYALGYVTECKAIKEAISKRFKMLLICSDWKFKSFLSSTEICFIVSSSCVFKFETTLLILFG